MTEGLCLEADDDTSRLTLLASYKASLFFTRVFRFLPLVIEHNAGVSHSTQSPPPSFLSS
jgi:hypothetical protein